MRRYDMSGSAGASWTARRDGGAYVVQVCPRTVFKFGVPTSGTTAVVPIVQGIPAYDWVSGLLVVRLHQVISLPAVTVTVNAANVSMVDDDPSIVFGTGTSIASVTIAGTAPKLFLAALTAPIGPMLEVNMQSGVFTGGGTVELAISVDVLGRTS